MSTNKCIIVILGAVGLVLGAAIWMGVVLRTEDARWPCYVSPRWVKQTGRIERVLVCRPGSYDVVEMR